MVEDAESFVLDFVTKYRQWIDFSALLELCFQHKFIGVLSRIYEYVHHNLF